MDNSIFKRKWFTNFKRKKKNLQENLLRKESQSKLSKEIKETFPDAELVKIEEENK